MWLAVRTNINLISFFQFILSNEEGKEKETK